MRCRPVTVQCRGVSRAANTPGPDRVGTTCTGAPTRTVRRDALGAREKWRGGVSEARPKNAAQQVHDLVDFLVTLRTCRTLTTAQQDTLIGLWEKLDLFDQRPQVFPRRIKEPPTGRFMASKTAKGPAKSNVEKTKRSFVGQGGVPAAWPNSNRYMEALVRRLMEIHPGPVKRKEAPAHTRWSLVLSSYGRIREVVMEDSRVMALTGLMLLAINQTTLSLWDRKRQEEQELSRGIQIDPPSFASTSPSCRPSTDPGPPPPPRPTDTTYRPTLQVIPTSGSVPRRPPACPPRQGTRQA